jgi:CHAT domain-containing protein
MTGAARNVSQRRAWIALITLIALSGVLAIVATVGLHLRLGRDDGLRRTNLGQLARLVGKHRLTRARLTGFEYAPCAADSSAEHLVRGLVCDSASANAWRKNEDKVSKFASEVRVASSGDAHLLGVWQLVWNSVDEAIASLRAAVRKDPQNAHAFNDLAVALTERAHEKDDPFSLIEAFVAADSAVRLDSTLKEAQFTQALVLERLYLRTDAIAAWKRYLELDSRSAWANEARQHLALLRVPPQTAQQVQDRWRRAISAKDSNAIRSLVAENRSDARVRIQENLNEWGTALVKGDSAGGRQHLDVAHAIVGAFVALTGDSLERDAIAAIDHAAAEKDAARTRALAEGHAALAGTEMFNGTKFNGASTQIQDAERFLANGKSPMSAWARLVGGRALANHRNSPSLAWLTWIRDSVPKRYVTLRSMAAQYQGFIYNNQGDYLHSVVAYDSALAENRTTDDPGVALRAGSWLAGAEDLIRGSDAGWRTRYVALAATRRFPGFGPGLWSVFRSMAIAVPPDAPRLSLRFADEVARIARGMDDSKRVTYALRDQADLLARVGRMDSARSLVSAALDTARHLGDIKLIADVKLVRAHVTLLSAPTEAERALREVIDEYGPVQFGTELPTAFVYLAQSRVGAGMMDSARAAFDSAAALLQKQRATIDNYAQREVFLDAARSVIDTIVAFHARENKRRAFEYFEGTRSRVLLEELADKHSVSAAQRPVLGELQRRLRKDDVVASYAVLPNELLIWSITRDSVDLRRVSVSASELEELVNRFQQSLADDSAEPDSIASTRLYRLLVDSTQIQRHPNLIVIPDRWLHYVPFVALQDPANGRFLVYEHAVSYAPSATLLLSSLARPPQRFSRASRVLAVGNPAFSRQAFQQLRNLPEARGEASRIASLYTDRKLLVDSEATDAALERSAPGAEILHFAGHAVVARDAPQMSHLVLASDGRSSGAVFSSAIAGWNLSRTRLAILSGCNTADGKLSATEGASSLARAFFAAGVPAVVSSLWAIEDDDTANFFVEFHRLLIQGETPSVALHETQIKWLDDGRSSGRPVRSWAAFQLFGG